MKKKTMLSLTAVIASSVIMGAIVVSQSGVSNAFNLIANSNEEWGHYDRKDSGIVRRGIKEYWVSCSSHNVVFSKPESGTIVDKGIPTQEFINSLSKEDERLIDAEPIIFDFENPDALEKIVDTTAEFSAPISIVDNEGIDSSKALKIQFNNSKDSGAFFKSSFLDLVFENPDVSALEFRARGDATCNFRHKNSSGGNICYEVNQNGYGLTNYWKTFAFSREMYEDIAKPSYSGAYVIFGMSSGTTGSVYVDNLRVTTDRKLNDDYLKGTYSCDTMGDVTGLGTNDVFVGQPYLFSGTDSGKRFFKFNASNGAVDSVSLSYEIKSEGDASIHLHKKSGANLYVYALNKYIEAYGADGFCFDVYTTSAVTKANLKYWNSPRQSGGCEYAQPSGITGYNSGLIANKWTTLFVPLEHSRDTSNDYDGFIEFEGSSAQTEMDIYIDNIRPINIYSRTGIADFESGKVWKIANGGAAGEYYYEYGADKQNGTENPLNGGNIRDFGSADIWFNGGSAISSAVIDDEHVSHGFKSLKVTFVSTGYFGLYLNKIFSNKLNVGDSVAFDVFNGTNGVIQLDKSANAGRSTSTQPCAINEWTTVTLTKDSEHASNFFRLCEGGPLGGIGSFWIDNVRIVKAA